MAQIKKDTSLRKAILQAAITGKLLSNVEGPTESGKQLLDRIIEEKLSHGLDFANAKSRKKKLKKETALAGSNPCGNIPEYEIPFEIPENWCWTRASEVCDYIVDCPHSTPKYLETKSEYCAIDTNCINEFGEITQYRFLNDIEYYGRVKRLVPEENDIIYTREGSICRAAILPSKKICLGQRVMLLRPSFGISSKFLQIYLMAPSTINILTQKSVGMGVQHINVGDVHNLVLPLPPLAVQNAIVEKLEQVLPLVDAYENAVLQKEELKTALPYKVKKAILQEAIEQAASFENQNSVSERSERQNGRQLLDHIIAERNEKALAEWEEALKKNPKAKKPVAVVASEIDEDEIPFEVPESWCWCHLGEICNEIKRGKSPKYADRSDYLAFAQKCNVKTGGIDLSLALYLDEKSIDRYSEADNLIQGDVVINSTGGGTMGRVGLYETKVPDGIKGVYPDSHVTVIRSIGGINQHYLYYVLKHNQPVLEDCGTGSTNQTELKPGVLADFVIPLPPLEEQEAIVKKVEELLPLCK